MSMKVIGIQPDNKFKIDGKEFKGCSLFLSYPATGVIGVRTEKVFISDQKDCYADALNVKVGDDINLLYNRYGKVEGILRDPS